MGNKKYNKKYIKYIKKINGIFKKPQSIELTGGFIQSFDWFECAFGFKEKSYLETKAIFEEMIIETDGKYLNKIKIGNFNLKNNLELHLELGTNTNLGKPKRGTYEIQTIKSPGIVTIQNIIADIKEIHKNKEMSENANIQVASQLNCLEMIDQDSIPEDGIQKYINDNTQGPICAISTPAGLAYRNYLYNGGQIKDNQINLAKDFFNFLKKYDSTINYEIKNGYLMFGNDNELIKINRILYKDHEIRKKARQLIQSGVHSEQGVFIRCTAYFHTVNHIYCSGLPILYNKLTYHLWFGISEIFLEAMYENSLLAACLNNKKLGKNRPCYLTHIGGGVFGMPHFIIKRAIQRACNIIAKNGLDLEVKIVNYKTISPIYDSVPKKYPIYTDIKSDSVWDNSEWISKSV